MEVKFKNILIPVDLSISTEVAIEKGLALAAEDAIIHLLHINNNSSFEKATTHSSSGTPGVIEKELNKLRSFILESKPKLTVLITVRQDDSIQNAIERQALKSHADLVIIGKNSNHSWFPFLNTIVPSEISQRTGIVVLTVKPGAIKHTIRSIVVPVSGESALHKLEVITAICGQIKIKIFLLTFLNEHGKVGEPHASPLLEVYQWLKSMHHPVEYALLPGHNKAKEILRYAEKIDADVLLLDPGLETKIGWPNKHISDVLPVSSKLQVLSI